MNISQSGLELIKKFEGFKDTPYKDLAGFLTIGFGHKIVQGEVFDTVTLAEANNLLMKDVQWAVTCINKYVQVQLNQHQFDALVSFTYNVGAHAFATSTMLKLINAGKLGEAANEFSKWSYASGIKSRGLANRRFNEREFFLTGTTL